MVSTRLAQQAEIVSQAVSDQIDILIVDDTASNLQVLSSMLEGQGYQARSALSGPAALRAAERKPPDLILLDIMMPQMDGYEVCRRLKEMDALKDVPVIFLSALNETADKIKAFSAGGADYVTKPFQFDEVRARVETHIKLRRLQARVEYDNRELRSLVRVQVQEIADSWMATIFALARLAESRDQETGAHLERVQSFCELISRRMAGLPKYAETIDETFIEDLVHASPLHDIGKVAIPDFILLKRGRLDDNEFEIMKTHTQLGAETLEAVRREYPHNAFILAGIDIAQSHHERWDGSGYPDGLAGESIPLQARVMALADVYDALRSSRCYKVAYPHQDSRDIILEGAGSQFDPDVVDAFSALHEEFDEVWNSRESKRTEHC